MPTSVICPPIPWMSPCKVPVRGFTLLELLVVMLLLGLLAGIAMPRLTQIYDSLTGAATLDDILSRINALGYQALREGRAFELGEYPPPVRATLADEEGEPAEADAPEPSGAPPPLELPPRWRLRADPPIRYHANGVCDGGTLELSLEDKVYQIELSPPFCSARFGT